MLKEQEEIPAFGHKEVKDEAVEATCTTAGKTEGSHCAICGKVLEKQEEKSEDQLAIERYERFRRY